MTTRLPNKRYIGDSVYAVHDGHQLIIETQDGIRVTNRIGLENDTLDGLMKYLEYARDFYRTGQHRASPDCEDCGRGSSTTWAGPRARSTSSRTRRRSTRSDSARTAPRTSHKTAWREW